MRDAAEDNTNDGNQCNNCKINAFFHNLLLFSHKIVDQCVDDRGDRPDDPGKIPAERKKTPA